MAYVGSINVVAFLAGVIRQKVFAVCLSPRGLGGLSLAASFFDLFTIVAGLGASVGLLREFTQSVAAGEPDRAARVFRDVQRIVLIVALVLGAVVTVLAPAIAIRLFASVLPWWSVPLLAAAAPFVLANELRHAAINGLGRTRVLAASSITTVILALIVAVWLVVTLELAGAILQLAVGAFIGLAVSQRFLARIFPPGEHEPARVPGEEARRAAVGALRVGAATAVQHLAVTANLFAFRSLVVVRLGPAANGLYHATMGLSRQYTTAILAGVFVYLYPRLAELSGRPAAFSRELSRSSGFALALVVPMSLVLLAGRDWLVRMVFTAEFSPMVPLLAYSLSGDVLMILAGVFRIALLASGRAWSFVMVGLLEEGLYLAAFLGGLRLWGLAGATQSYVAAAALGLALYGIALWRRGECALSARRLLQMVLVLPAVALVAMSPVGRWSSRALALGLALGWLVLWRRELVSGLRP
jgi:O-antigen/teichoic acid export membrane protein